MSVREPWTIDVPEPLVEVSGRRARVVLDEVTVAESATPALLSWYGPNMLPTYCFAPSEVSVEHLLPSDAEGPRPPHTAAFDVDAGGSRVNCVAYRFEEPPGALSMLAGHWTFAWDRGLRWFEEALEVHVHARDPHKRVDAVPSDRRIRVEVAGMVVAESTRPLAVFETTLPTRWYLPLEDVRLEHLVDSPTITRCPYKGTASYFNVVGDGVVHEDIAWTYRETVVENPRLLDLVSFFNERVDLYVDGALQERPRTPWSTGDA